MLYQAVYHAGGAWHTLCFMEWQGPDHAVVFAERFIKRLEPWYNDARLTHVHPSPKQARLELKTSGTYTSRLR